jgi:chemotaxis protein methyltransferase CheR
MGLFFPQERWADLERKLREVAPVFGCSDAESCARFLTSTVITKLQLDLLATYLTVGETYFFREPRSLEALEHHILPELLRQRRGVNPHLRLWSAACCSGEEPYSIAIILQRLIPDLPSWKLSLLATDISPRFLHKATEGLYGQWSFRNVPLALREQHFHRVTNGRYAIRSELKHLVRFAQLNLAQDQYPSQTNNTADLDVIFCRNVLIYFAMERTQRVIEGFYRSLNEGGWLIVSPVETALVMDSRFTPVQFPGALLFRKDPERRTSYSIFDCSLFPTQIGSSAIEGISELEHALPSGVTTLSDFTASVNGVTRSVKKTPEVESDLSPKPDANSALYEDACMLYAQGRYEETVEKLLSMPENQALSSNPLRERTTTLLARAYANQGQLAEARTWCDEALSTNRFDASLHYLRATILLEHGQDAEARLSLTRAVYLDPRFVLAHVALGNLARQQRESMEARKHFQNALVLLQQQNPDDILPESEGMSVGRLAQIIADMNARL